MENQRLFLWSVLAIIVFIMMQTWQKDYAPVPPPVSEQLTPGVETTALPELGAPVATGITDATLDDTIDAPAAQSAEPAKPIASVSRGKSINVTTDVYDIKFNTLGGDIREMVLSQHLKSKKNLDDRVGLFTNNEIETYALNSGLRANGVSAEPTHQALWQSAQTDYVLAEGDILAEGENELKVPFTWRSPEGLEVTKTYTFRRGSYAFTVDYHVDNQTSIAVGLRTYAQLARSHPPLERSMVSVDSYSFKGSTWFDGDKYEKLKTKDLIKQPINTQLSNAWLATIEHHFLAAIIPQADTAYTIQATSKNEQSYKLTTAAPGVSVAPGQSLQLSQQFFAGPKNQKALRALSPRLDLTTDYGFFSIISKPLFWLLDKVHSLIGNWGWSIVVVTLIIKLVFYPLTAKSARSMAAMKKIQPRMKILQERHKDDRQALSKATMEMYKREKINPAAGCLPIFIQFPFFLGFYWLLIESVELRQAPWMLWIQDLSSKDPLFILPVLYGITMYLQQKVQPMTGGNPEMMKVMKYMPIAMVALFSFFPAGLVLYWITNSAVTVLQQWHINKTLNIT